MAKQSGEDEGQALARRVLEALDADRFPDWADFYNAYSARLLHAAGRRLSRYSELRGGFDGPEELVDAFLADKVMPPRAARQMFGGPARGEGPLWPRLATSLGNYCIDALRSGRPPQAGEAADALTTATAHEDLPLPDYEEVEAVIRRQVNAIRSHLRLSAGAPYRPAVLLRHRLDWAGAFYGVTLKSSGGKGDVELSLAVLEQLTVWQTNEKGTRLGESQLTLRTAWEELKPRLLDASYRRLSSNDLAGVLRIPRALWDQWISRGRRRLRQELDAAYAEIFALWA